MWEINIADQTVTFVVSMGIGGLFCTVYDIIRAMRKVCINSFFAVFFADIIIWVIYAFLTFIFLMSRTNGEIRGYVLVGELLGFILWRVSMSKVIFPLFAWIFINFAAVNRKISDHTGKIYIKVEKIVFKFLRAIASFLKCVTKSVKKLLKKGCGLLYTNINNVNVENVLNETKTEA